MQTIYLDISNKGVYPCIYAKQGDVNRNFLLIVTDGGVPFDCEDMAISVWYDGDSGEGNYTHIGEEEAISVTENKITVSLIQQMLVNAGKGVLSVSVSDASGSQIGLWNIEYCVEQKPGAESEEATKYYDAFSQTAADLAEVAKTFVTDATLSKSGSPADAAETGKMFVSVKNSIDKEKAERLAEIAVERARINQFTALAEGSTTGDAELMDIRVGYDGTTYESAGEAVRAQISDIASLKEIDVTWIEGKFINSVGLEVESASYNCTDFIPLMPRGIFIPLQYDVIINPNTYVALYDAEKKFISGITVEANVTNAKGVVGSDSGASYLRVTTLNYYKDKAKISVANIADIGFVKGSVSKDYLAADVQKTVTTEAGQAELDITFTQGGFISQDGTVGSHSAYSYAEYVDINGLTGVKIVANFSGAACIALFNKYKKRTRSILNTGNTGDLMEITFAENERYMSVSCNFYLPTPFVCYATNMAASVIKAANLANDDNSKPLSRIITDGGNCAIFRTIGVVGDSLASGAMAYGDATDESTTQYMDMYEYSWIQYIARACGSVGHNFSMGGLSTRTFLADVGGYRTKLEDGNHKCQAYFVALGHNDKNQSVPIGTADDIDLNNSANNADTYYGNYAAIISRIKAVQPYAKIFVVCMKHNSFAAYNVAVRHMATIFDNVYVLDFEQYCGGIENWEFTQGHGNAMGYLNYANQIATYVDWIIRNNRDDFKYVQFIGTEAEQYIPAT